MTYLCPTTFSTSLDQKSNRNIKCEAPEQEEAAGRKSHGVTVRKRVPCEAGAVARLLA